MKPITLWLSKLSLPEGAECRLNSQAIKPGDVFVAIQGETDHGRHYILDAIARGASAVIIEGYRTADQIPQLSDPELRKRLPDIATFFYGSPAKNLGLTGITGTNGKTSVSHLIAQIWNQERGQKGAILGTLGIGLLDNLSDNTLTTPDVLSVYRALKQCADSGATKAAIEVSSHALMQGRVAGLSFDAVVLTNVTQDHLDYHKTMANYWKAKQRLFTDYVANTHIINLDDPYGEAWMLAVLSKKMPLRPGTRSIGYGLTSEKTKFFPGLETITVSNREQAGGMISAQCHSPWGAGQLTLAGIGDFQLSNALAAIGAACSQGASFTKALETLSHCQPVPGRVNMLGGNEQLPLVVIDFAHTPDALAQVLKALRPQCQGTLSVVFGCGGERDRAKRPLMVQAALALADHAWITLDNPRHESQDQIIQDMLQENPDRERITIELDRQQAVARAILAAHPGDLVLLAGKGHETAQMIGSEVQPYSDAAAAQQALAHYSH